MQERFEDFLEKNRSLPDLETPDDEKIWRGVSANLEKTRRLRLGFLSAAAVILILVSSGIVLNHLGRKSEAENRDASLGILSRQLEQEEIFFRNAVIQKLDEVRKNSSVEEGYAEMMEQLDLIDRQYAIYVSDLQELGNQPKILRGIIRCYEMKIRVIEKRLNEIEKNKKHENKNPIL